MTDEPELMGLVLKRLIAIEVEKSQLRKRFEAREQHLEMRDAAIRDYAAKYCSEATPNTQAKRIEHDLAYHCWVRPAEKRTAVEILLALNGGKTLKDRQLRNILCGARTPCI